MKVLFLDFDGVLNSCNWFRQRKEAMEKEGLTTEESHIDPSAVAHLNTIIEQTNCTVVISSTWRLANSPGYLLRLLVKRGLDKNHWDNFHGFTPNLQKERGHEIQAWLDHGIYKICKNIVILDDDADMVHLMPHLIPCNGIEGLTAEVAAKAIEKLNNQRQLAVEDE